MPLLSICIPTYNRANDLNELIQKIFQINCKNKSKIEICISNNASIDNTHELIQELQIKSPISIIYNNNIENIGFDKNLLKTLEIANGKYIMLLGDDDFIENENFLYLLKILNENDYDAVFSNYRIFNYQKPQENFLVYKNKPDNITNFNEILLYLNEKITFMSSIILKKSVINLNSEEIINCIGLNFIHVAICMNSLKHSNNILYYNKPLVSASNKNPAKYDIVKIFIEDLGNIVKKFEKYYSKKSIKMFINKIFIYVFFELYSKNKLNIDIKKYKKYGYDTICIRFFILLSSINSKMAFYICKLWNKLLFLRGY